MRYIYLALFALVLGLPFVLRYAVLTQSEPAVVATGSSVPLVIVTPHTGDIRRDYARAFDAWYRARYHQSVAIDFRVPGGTNDMVRLLTSTYGAGRRPGEDYDVVWGGGDYTFYHSLQPAGVLQPMHIDPALLREAFPTDALAGVRLYDGTRDAQGKAAPQWVGVCLSSFGIIYNPQLYATLGLGEPRAWADLTSEKLFGLIALADPAHSGSAAVSYMMVIQRAMADAERRFLDAHPQLAKLSHAELNKRPDYQQAIADGWHEGMGQLLLIAANARYFTDSSSVVPTDVGAGDAAAGMAIDFYARMTGAIVGPERARFVAPHAATAITPDPVAILNGVSGERLTRATRFVEFLLTPQAQRLWILAPGQPGGPIGRSLMRMPIRRDVYADQAGWADHFNPFEEAGDFNQRGQWMALMNETSPIWDAAWIDSRDALVASYRTILRVDDAARRGRLLHELADVPVTMREVEEQRATRTRLLQQHADVDEWSARQRIVWGKRFREHYAKVAARAR